MSTPVLISSLQEAETLFQSLKKRNFIDKEYGKTVIDGSQLPNYCPGHQSLDSKVALIALSKEAATSLRYEYEIVMCTQLPRRKKRVRDPKKAVEAVLREWAPADLTQGDSYPLSPLSWEKLDDLILLPHDYYSREEFQRIEGGARKRGDLGELYTKISTALGGKGRLAVQHPIAANDHRRSQVVLLSGESDWVEHVEHGVKYGLHVTKNMFSSGNVTERGRVGTFDAAGETVVDLYCGIGFFTLPFLVRAGASMVYAVDHDYDAVAALRQNLRLNNVEESRCYVYHGDNRDEAFLSLVESKADRAHLGFLPHAREAFWPAIRCLKSSGGRLHVHENVRDGEEKKWADEILRELLRIAETRKNISWTGKVEHIEKVKWYAPRIRHVVADIDLWKESGDN